MQFILVHALLKQGILRGEDDVGTTFERLVQ
jgi:hypothetical protein